jgi:hypothetical protein
MYNLNVDMFIKSIFGNTNLVSDISHAIKEETPSLELGHYKEETPSLELGHYKEETPSLELGLANEDEVVLATSSLVFRGIYNE